MELACEAGDFRLETVGNASRLAFPYSLKSPVSCLRRDAGGSRTHWMRLCRPPPRRVTSASSIQCPCQESNLVYDLRRVACVHHTPRTNNTPPRNRTSPDCFEGSHASSTPAGHEPVSRPGIEPGPGPSESPMRSATPSGQSRRLVSHQHDPVYRTGAFLHQPRRHQHEREDSNPIRQFWRLLALPGASLV